MTPRTVARQAPLSMGFSRPEYWSGLPFPSPGNLPDSGIEPSSPALAGGFFINTTETPRKLTRTFAVALFIIVKIWKQRRGSSVGKEWINYGTFRKQNIIQHWKDMSYQGLKRHGGNLNVYYKEKEANLKSLNAIWLQPYDIVEK